VTSSARLHPSQQKVKRHFQFQVLYGWWKNFQKCDVTCSWTPSSVKICHTFSDPLPPLERDVGYFMDGPYLSAGLRNADISGILAIFFARSSRAPHLGAPLK